MDIIGHTRVSQTVKAWGKAPILTMLHQDWGEDRDNGGSGIMHAMGKNTLFQGKTMVLSDTESLDNNQDRDTVSRDRHGIQVFFFIR